MYGLPDSIIATQVRKMSRRRGGDDMPFSEFLTDMLSSFRDLYLQAKARRGYKAPKVEMRVDSGSRVVVAKTSRVRLVR